jgi:two-component system, sensor histidine kinase and response regulator
MKANLRILILEDNQNDADLINRELNKGGLSFTSETVQTRERFEHALEHFIPDIILSDYSLPSFDAVTAFDIKQNKFPQIPFIIVSGVIGEENAVELIKKGVTDYTPKDKLFTLSLKINRALKEKEERKEKEIIAEKLKVQAAALIIANKELHEKAQLLLLQEKKLISTNDDLLSLNQHLENRVFERTCDLENLNHELKGLNISKDKFLSVISHDLRNPLTALLLASDMLNRQIEDEIFKVIKPFAKIINRSSHNIMNQLNELVDWAKRQQGKTILNAERLHLADTVDQSFELIKANALQKNIILENKVPNDTYVNADTLMLRSILQNLVTNAIKFSAEGGLVSVMAELKDNMVEIGITDRGIGMDANFSANLFQEFNTATVPGTNNEKGSGIGLKLVKDFVTQNRGTLRVESEIKKGTSILFTLPVA